MNPKKPLKWCPACRKEKTAKYFAKDDDYKTKICGFCWRKKRDYYKPHIHKRGRRKQLAKGYGRTLEEYENIVKKCFVCNWTWNINLHHLDENRANNELSNQVGLCPNHHTAIHTNKYKKEVLAMIAKKKDEETKKKGINIFCQ